MRPALATLVPQAVLALAASAGLVLLHRFVPDHLERYLRDIPPIAVALLLPVVAVASLRVLRARAGLRIVAASQVGNAIALSALLASLFALPPIAIDHVWGLASGNRIDLPVALAFYPVMAFVAETAFHLLPLAILVGLAGKRGQPEATVRSLWPILIAVAFIEPGFQIWLRLPLEGPVLLAGFVAIHVLAFNLAQLCVFVRYGFAAMLAMRVVYYLWWHIAWGG